MKKTGTNFLTRCLCLIIVTVMFVSLLPFEVMAIPAEASAKMHPISLVHFIADASKAIGGFRYADDATDMGSENFYKNYFENWWAYFSGNADFKEEIFDLKACMAAQCNGTSEVIAEISTQVLNLKDDIETLMELQGYEALKVALNAFYTDFFSNGYDELLAAYREIEATLSNSYANEATLKTKMDDLYMKAYKLESISDYITGKNQIDGKSILDMYLECLKKSGDFDDISEVALDFTLKMFEAAIFQKYCMSYASAYQLNYVNDQISNMTANGDFIGYVVDGSLDGFTNKYTISEIKSHISAAKSEMDSVAVAVIKNLVNIYDLDESLGYTEDGCQYCVSVSNREANVYTGASYQFMSISNELAEMFDLKLYYVANDDSVASCTASGCVTINGSTGQNFEVSYMYGDGIAENSRAIYTVKFNICERVFSGGYGIIEAPYLIGSKKDLKRFASDSSYWKSGVYVKLIEDIDMSGDSLGTIENYYGSFDGGGHTISNLSRSFGWFTYNYGVIENLDFSKMNISRSGAGSAFSGGIADSNNGTIFNCNITSSTVYCYGHNLANGAGYKSLTLNIGGIAGENYGIISRCNVISSKITSAVSSKELFIAGYTFGEKDLTLTLCNYVGGIVGITRGGEVSDCYVKDSTIISEVYAGYKKSSKFWAHTYTRVAAYCGYGRIAGSTSDTSMYSNTYNGTSVNNSVSKLNYDKKDDSFVIANCSNGNDGSYTSNTSVSPYISALTISKLPQKTEYTVGETFNCAGLEVIDNNAEAVHGFTVSVPSTSTEGEQTVTVSIGDLSVDFSVSVVSCYHKTIRYDAEQQSTCKSNGYTAGVYCLDCNTYTDGHEVIIKNDSAHHWENDICTECGASKQSGSIPKTDARIKVSGATCSSNASQVRVPIVMENNPGVVSVQLTVTYDEQAMELIGLEDGGILGTTLHSDEYANGYKMSWGNDTANKNLTDNGTIATLVFKLKPNVSDGEYQVSLSYNYSNFDIMDVNMNCVAFEVQDGYISVTSSLIGDVNGDGKVLPNDRVILARTLAGWSDYPMDAIDQIAADVDGNGKVNQRDRMILSRYLAGWSDYSKLPYTQN